MNTKIYNKVIQDIKDGNISYLDKEEAKAEYQEMLKDGMDKAISFREFLFNEFEEFQISLDNSNELTSFYVRNCEL